MERKTTPNILDDVMSATPLGPAKPAATPLRIAEIRRDGGTQPRAGLDETHVADLLAAIAAGDELPPVDVTFDGTAYWLYDGFHRVEATSRHGKYTVAAIIHQGTQADAQWASYAANSRHGLKRTNDDKRRQVLAALRHPTGASMSNREIARHVGVDEGTVRNYREQLEATAEIPQIAKRAVTRGGSTYTQNTARIGANQPARPQPKRDDAAEDAWRPPRLGALTRRQETLPTTAQPRQPVREVVDGMLFAIAERASLLMCKAGTMPQPMMHDGAYWLHVGGVSGIASEYDTADCVRVHPDGEPIAPGVRINRYRAEAFAPGTELRHGANVWRIGEQWLVVKRRRSLPAQQPAPQQPAVMPGVTAHTWEGYSEWTADDDAEYAALAPIWQQPAATLDSISESRRITRWRVAARLASERRDNLAFTLQESARRLMRAERYAADDAAAVEAARQAAAVATADATFGLRVIEAYQAATPLDDLEVVATASRPAPAATRREQLADLLAAVMAAAADLAKYSGRSGDCILLQAAAAKVHAGLTAGTAPAEETWLPEDLVAHGWQLRQVRGKWVAFVQSPGDDEIRTQAREKLADVVGDARYMDRELRIGEAA